MKLHEYPTTFYRLNADGPEGEATRVGLKIMKATKVEWRSDTWALTEVITRKIKDTKITSARLSRSRTAEILQLRDSGDEMHLEPRTLGTHEFVPIAFFHDAHTFAIASRPLISTAMAVRALRFLARSFAPKASFLPVLREQSLVDRLKSYDRITELTISIVRANPESSEDTKLFTDELKDSRVQRALLRIVGDPRGINLNGKFIKQQINYVEDGLGKLASGKGINASGNEERISGAKTVRASLMISSDGSPSNFAKQLADQNPLPGSSKRSRRQDG